MIPFLCFYTLEFYTHDPWKMAVIPQLLNYLFFLSAWFFWYELTGSGKIGFLFIMFYAAVAGIANYFVMDFRNNPILPWDIRSVMTALSVSDNYEYKFNYRFLICTAVWLFMLAAVLLVKPHTRTIKLSLSDHRRSIPCAVSALLFVLLAVGMMDNDFTDSLLTPTNLFTQWASYRDNGFTVTFIQNMQYLRIQKPDGYNRDTLDEELADFMATHKTGSDLSGSSESDSPSASSAASGSGNPSASSAASGSGSLAGFSAYDHNQNTETLPAETPNVIVIMNESFADLSVLHEFDTTEDYMPFVHSLQASDQDNVLTGNLFVSVCGGNTANSEFEFLTGNTMAFLPPGSIPYQQYVLNDIPSLASQFSEEGYITAGLHPYNSTGWNRDKVYPWMGFQDSYFRKDFKTTSLIRKYVSDQDAFQKLKDLFRQKAASDRMFLFEVTMQNHGGYSEIFDNFPIQVELTDIESYSSKALENYLSLIQESDRAFENLVHYFEGRTEPVIILMFGDHQPNDYVSENIASLTGHAKEDRSLKEAQNRYVVPYVIWSNYALDKSGISASSTFSSDTTLSPNYLGTWIASLSGMELTPYQEFLQLMRTELPVITANVVINRDGTYMTADEARKQYPEWFQMYEKLQYRYLFDL